MLRNRFLRSLSQPLPRTVARTVPSIAATAYSSLGRLEFPGKFICISCQVRALASHARRGRGTRASGFLGTIKRLEAHVQLIEKRAADLAIQDAARKKLPDIEMTEEMQDKAYAALMTPGSKTAAFLPQPKTVSKMLPAPVLERLGGAAALVDTSAPLWGAVIGQLRLNGGFQGMEIVDVNCLLMSMDLKSRAERTSELQDMMQRAKLEPDTFTYDLLMMAHAHLKHPEEVKILFQDLKRRGVAPTVFTYAHLLKAYSLRADFEEAGKAFIEMREADIHPNIVVYTTLIQTCLKRREVPTAWQLFDLMKLKSRATAPDAHTFALMLHACALEGESERALNLFRDMTDRMKLKPTKETYHALIHALAVRKDYYQEVWQYATEMQQEGFRMDRRVLGTLIQACGKRGDLTRARMLIRHMLGSGKEDIIPTSATYQCLFRAYANAKVVRKFAKFAKDVSLEASMPYVGPDTRLVEQEESFKEDALPFSQNTILNDPLEIMREARRVMRWLCAVKPDLVDTQLMNAFLDVYCDRSVAGVKIYHFRLKRLYGMAFTDPKESDYIESAVSSTEAKDLIPEPNASASATDMHADMHADIDADRSTDGDSPYQFTFQKRVPRNLYTFQIALNSAYRNRDLLFAWDVYNDRIKYLRTKQYSEYREPERERLDVQAECSLINTLARCRKLGKAAAQLQAACLKHKICRPDITTLYLRAKQLDDPETLNIIKKCVGSTPYRNHATGVRFRPRWGDRDQVEELSGTL